MKRFFAALTVVFSLFSVGNAAIAQNGEGGCTFARQVLPKPSIQTAISVSEWKAVCTRSDRLNPEPESTRAFVARIDLGDKRLSFTATPAQASSGHGWQQETTSQFLTRTGSSLAINANLFNNCCGYDSPTEKPWLGLGGWAVSGGTVVQPHNVNDTNQHFPFDTSLVILAGGQARIVTTGKHGPIPDAVQVAITGSHRLLLDGAISQIHQSSDNLEFFSPNARTLAGLSIDNQTLWLIAVNGKYTSKTDNSGLTLNEAAHFLLQLGAKNGINLDGGGSSTMVQDMFEFPGKYKVLNLPSDGTETCTDLVETVKGSPRCERYVGLNFGIRLRSQIEQKPEP